MEKEGKIEDLSMVQVGISYNSLRRFLHKLGPIINAELEIDISNLKFSDFGNLKENLDFAEY